MGSVVDTVIVYKILRKLVTPFIQMPAYHLGIIDENGNFLKKVANFSSSEKEAVTPMDVMVINLKRILGKLPGGRSQLASFAAALYLIRAHGNVNESNIMDTLFTLEEDFNRYLEEDAPANSAGAAGVYGTRAGETVVTNSAAKRYKAKNKKMGIARRIPTPVIEDISLQYHNNLNPKLWDDGQLKPEVRGKLIQFAETWREFAMIPKEMVEDVVMTGGNANYNYTDLSDIDVHLVVDRDGFGLPRDFIDQFLQDKKILWTMTHPDIKVYGYPLEPYAQDLAESIPMGQGQYSLMNDEWIQMPLNLHFDFSTNRVLQDKVEHYKQVIDRLIRSHADDKALKAIKTKITAARGPAIAKEGEFSLENLVFKELRNQGYIDKIDMYTKSEQDRALSL
jgi:hypothetical protein